MAGTPLADGVSLRHGLTGMRAIGLRMETLIAQLRCAVVVLAGAAFLSQPYHQSPAWLMISFWALAVVYAGGVLAVAPYRHIRPGAWHVVSGFVDWGLITVGVIATGGQRSDLYALYFLSVLSTALRYGFREVLIAGMGTALGYCGLVVATASAWPAALQEAGFRMGYLIIFAVGSGVLAREFRRQFRGRIKEEAQRLVFQEATATLSHDLLNPLTAVDGIVEMLLDGTPSTFDTQRGLLHRIRVNTRYMNNLVSNLLDAQLIEKGQPCCQPQPVNVNDVVRRVVDAQAQQVEAKRIGLVLDLNEHLPLAEVDGRMVERLVANLLNNAVKFAPEDGAVRISTRLHAARVAIEVWDSGPGIPADIQPRLFEKFARDPRGRGVGLGLYICKSIVEAHHGSIAVQRAGAGAAFVAELPITRPEAVRSPSAAAGRPTGGEARWQRGASALARHA